MRILMTKQGNNCLFFFKDYHSQWFKSEFVALSGRWYNCCEQYMMYCKAFIFGDIEIAEQIMKTSNPSDQKQLGRMVKGFDQKVWDANKFQIVMAAQILKFEQNPDLFKRLLMEKVDLYVEASRFDKVWGIGLADDSPLIDDETLWKGANLLGQAITNTKELLLRKAGIKAEEVLAL